MTCDFVLKVGVKIDASSFSLTRLVTVLPFYMLVNRTKHVIRVCEEEKDDWTEAKPGEVNTQLFNLVLTALLVLK